LASRASKLKEANDIFASLLSRQLFEDLVTLIPDKWLNEDKAFNSVDENRDAYVDFLVSRLNYSKEFINEASI
jgi:hypothetical protein